MQPASVDLHLGDTYITLEGRSIDRYGPNPRGPATKTHTITDEAFLPLFPGQFVLAEVKEYIRIPDTLIGKLEGKSTLARDGLVVENAGFVEIGRASCRERV